MGISNPILKILFPDTCPICGNIVNVHDNVPCSACKREVRYIREPRCRKCGRQLYDMEQMVCTECEKRKYLFDAGVCIFEHSAGIRRSIYQFKYSNRRDYADFYGREAARVYGRQFQAWKIDMIVPVPIHKSREKKRGYNQALEFGKAVSKYTGIAVEKKALVRIRKTVPQKELTAAMRYSNLKNAFAVDKSRIKKNGNVLIVDDIYTTGSTIDACSQILKKAGVSGVYFLCISAGGI